MNSTFLLIEDDEVKRNRLEEFLRATYPDVTVKDAQSLQSGLRSAISEVPNLVLLDMNLPTYDITAEETGGRIQQFAGREFLRQLRRRKINVPVIVITHFDYFGDGKDRTTLAKLDGELREEYSNMYFGAVSYRATLDDWKKALLTLIREALGGSEGEI